MLRHWFMRHYKTHHHYLCAHYITRQQEGVHIDGRCSCGATLEGTGHDENEAFDALWNAFSR